MSRRLPASEIANPERPVLPADTDPEALCAFVLQVDAVNFGSGYFPLLRKRPGLSGYFTVATSLREQFEARGPWSAADLVALEAVDCAKVFGQDLAVAEVAELMTLFARALNDLGALLNDHYDARFERLVAAAGGSAERLAKRLLEMPFFRDVAAYDGLEVPFLKRAQLLSADLAAAFDGEGYGRFDDLDRLTIFADNLVPHALRIEGVLRYDPGLVDRIERGELIPAGSAEEVEIRAGAVHAVERLVAHVRENAPSPSARVSASAIDYLLWNRGQRPEVKAQPRHRTRTVYY